MRLLVFVLLLAAQQRPWRPEDRLLITATHEVGAITRDQRRIYNISPGAITIYDFTARRWDAPLTVEDGVPPFDLPTAAEYEPVLSEVWVGTRGGLIYRYRGVPFRIEAVAGGIGSVQALVALPAVDDYVYARTTNGWFRIRRSSFSAQQVNDVPAEVARAAAARTTLDPALNAFRASLGLDPQGQRWPLTAFVRDERPERYWFGTRGGGTFFFDALRQSSDWHWFGSASESVPAIAASATHIWFGGDGRGLRRGVAQATHDLQRWDFQDARIGAPQAVNEMALRGDDLWAATPDGVFALQQGRWSRIGSGEANTLFATAAGVWATSRNEVFELASARPRVIVQARSIERVGLVRDSLWILADRAILRHFPGDTVWVRNADPPVTERLIDVAARADTTFLLAGNGLYVHDGREWAGPQPWLAAANLGRPRRLTLTPNGIWIAAERGAAFTSAGRTTVYRAPQDIPAGPVFQVLDIGNYVWFATPAGALRIEKRP